MIKSKIDWEWSEDTLADIILQIIEKDNNREGEVGDDFDKGRHFAYYEIIDSIKNALEWRGFDFEEFLGAKKEYDKNIEED